MSRIIHLILSCETVGEGTDDDVCRQITSLHTLDGECVLVKDPAPGKRDYGYLNGGLSFQWLLDHKDMP